jgi:regulator of protease activity HflC (stomatin/prohibitin superfamily)
LLDNVDALIDATVRFRIPEDDQAFLHLAREFRTSENFITTGILPSIRQTLNATSSLMGAEEYYSGGRTEFNNEFEFQMNNGLYEVRRIEKNIKSNQEAPSSANASKDNEQGDFGSSTKTIFVVEKRVDASGNPTVNPHSFTDYGIQIVSAVITDLEPNDAFVKRMESKQRASADRAIAREQRIQEQEAKELAIAKGQREVAEKQAEALKDQIGQTTKAETQKQLAITEANKFKEQAAIAEQTSVINLRKAEIEAKATMVTADADAYAKKAVIQANNALELKLDAYKFSQEKWAEAYAKRSVPQFMMGDSTGSTGSNTDAQLFQTMLNAMIAKDLALDLNVDKQKK